MAKSKKKEIVSYYYRKKPQLQKRLDNEKVIKFKSGALC